MPNFSELGIQEQWVKTLKENGITVPTPVQEETIPLLLAERDVIARARTGTGKTLAFLLPMMQKLDPSRAFPQALIIAPTRELALQITEEARKLSRGTELRILAVYGGQDVDKQLRKLEGGRHLIIGTPGRLNDHLRRGTLELGGVKTLVLDEADQMLHMGFLDEVETLIQALPYKRQTLLFSATMPSEVKQLASFYTRDAEDVTIKVENSPVPLKHIRQLVVEVSDRNKQQALISMIESNKPYLAIIFCRTKRRASTLNAALLESGYASDELHGDLSQAKREQVMKRFREAKLQLLVATDVAARGLDVEGVTHVFNYDIPLEVDSYIHRIGRTGRAGEKGMAITFVAPRDKGELQRIEQGIQFAIERSHYEKSGEIVENRGASRSSAAGRSSRNEKDGRRGEGRVPGGRRGEGRTSTGGRRGEGRTSTGGRRDEGRASTGGRRDEGRASEGRPSQGRSRRDDKPQTSSSRTGGEGRGGSNRGSSGSRGQGRGESPAQGRGGRGSTSGRRGGPGRRS
ncbi:DEAD/DEAH box helicase [Paenibacillus dokdonensis]|uniref:DEAD/DEAH box helicase n=1 Tax=Paenibacillus dokdonensis TaxID=2567944 RepID=UPI0010A8CEDC|nr:DEAD/DEAH box helicase [Paenibacillus dokdonensis]